MTDLAQRLAGLSPEKRALLMQQLGRQSTRPPASTLVGRERPSRLPLSSAQQRLWVLDQLDPGAATYNVTLSLWLDGPLDRDTLVGVLGEIVGRHESLRTVFCSDAEGPFQKILAPAPFDLVCHDVSDATGSAAETKAFDLARLEAARPFSLSDGPVFRAELMRLSAHRHLLVLNAHHIAVDGWSLSILNTELRQLYDAFLAEQPSPLQPLTVQYADYALWQREELESPAMARQLSYWSEHLAGLLPVLDLPGDRARPPVQSHRGATLRFALEPAVFEGMRQLARSSGATPFMVLLAAYSVVLMRHCGQDDLVIGAGVANRRRQELESVVGFFVNTLALRVDVSGNPSFRDLLARVREVTLGGYSNQDIPVERVMEVLELERTMSYSPLFQTMVFYQNFPSAHTAPSGLRQSPVHFDQINGGTSRCDLSVFASEQEGSLSLFLEYATDLFDADTIVRLAAHVQELLRNCVAQPDARIGELEILTPDEKLDLLQRWNDTARAADGASTVDQCLLEQCARTPEAIAVEQGDERLTYGALDEASAALTAHLRALGVGCGARVGLMVERTPRMLVGMLGILRAGAAYVPLDPAYPHERLAWMLEDAEVAAVVSDRASVDRLPNVAAPLVLIDELTPPCANADGAIDGPGPDDIAYVIFTSGSTGRPKGVAVPHRAVVNFLRSMATRPGLCAHDVVCAVTTLSFDIAVLELLLPLSVGARVALTDRVTVSDGAALAAHLDACGATVMQATPATWRLLIGAGWAGRPGLRILCGGEALTRDLADALLVRGAEVWNLYGPTETTVWSCVEEVKAGDGPISIGRPIDNTRVHIADRRSQLAPVGVPGELLIGGDGVALGYIGRADLTAERFIADPWGPPGARLYRTGDLARWRADGRLEVVGRLDYQIKLRGYRIELGEIESVLVSTPGIRQAIVVCREDRAGDRRLVAYVTGDSLPTVESLQAAARARLPEYMVPSAYVRLDAFPLTPNGKVDRKLLPAPERERVVAAASTPRTADEATLASLWAEVLGVAAVGIHDDFFALGGHSLLATQLLTRIQSAFGEELTLRMVFDAPTVAQFAERVLASRVETIDADALAGMLDQLEGLSEDDIQALLAGEGQTA